MRVAVSHIPTSVPFTESPYTRWLLAADPSLELVNLTGLAATDAAHAVASCSGLVLTGGEDVAPERYGLDAAARSRCGTIDEQRDEREAAAYLAARDHKIPVLAICRGAQLVNVLHGGTLVVDIPTEVKTEVEHRKVDGVDSRHAVEIEPGTLLAKAARTLEGEINSAHHQAALKLATEFVPAAYAPDRVVEAYQFAEPMGEQFLLAVQWHPERMEYSSPFSMPLAERFLFEVQSYSLLHNPGGVL